LRGSEVLAWFEQIMIALTGALVEGELGVRAQPTAPQRKFETPSIRLHWETASGEDII